MDRSHIILRPACATFLLLVAGAWCVSAQNRDETVPVVIAAAAPFYPRVALLAHITGTVTVRVATDGKKISALSDESGPPMLVRAAEENIRSWEFQKHKGTTFVTTFQYKIDEPADCVLHNDSVALHLPLEVQISARGVQTCDPASEKRRF